MVLNFCLDISQLAVYSYALMSPSQWVANILPFVAGINLMLALLLMGLYLIVIVCLIFIPDYDKLNIEGNSKPKKWRYLVSGLNLLAAYCFAAQANYSIGIMIAVTEIICFVAFSIKDGILQSLQSEAVK